MSSDAVPMNVPPAPGQPPVRPTRFTIWCALGFVNAAYTIWWLYSGHAADGSSMLGIGLIGGTLLATVLGVIGLSGYWFMRKWGVYVYSAATVVMAATVLVGAGPLVVAIRMAVVAGFGWFFVRDMA